MNQQSYNRELSVSLNGLEFSGSGMDSAVDSVIAMAVNGQCASIRLTNAYSVALADSMPDYAAILRSPGINFPDGTPLVWALRKLSRSPTVMTTVRGPSLFRLVLDRGREASLRHFFLGTTDTTLRKLRDTLNVEYEGVQISGVMAPDFGPLSESFYDDAVRQIAASGANVVWVGLGTPKQDFAAAELAVRTGMVCVAVGAAFDFLAGTSAEAPSVLQGSGFEWMFRLYKEPRRLWRRYFFGNARFLKIVSFSLCKAVILKIIYREKLAD